MVLLHTCRVGALTSPFDEGFLQTRFLRGQCLIDPGKHKLLQEGALTATEVEIDCWQERLLLGRDA